MAYADLAQTCTFEEFLIGKIWASKRTFNVELGEGKVYSALIPFFEYCATDVEAEQNVVMCQEVSTIKIIADRFIQRGEPLVLKSLCQPNVDVLINSGFVIENNPFDVVSLECELNLSDPLLQVKQDLLESTETKFRFHLTKNFSLPQAFKVFNFMNFITYSNDPSFLVVLK